jgi:REP element-mobilizing transposase RayT
LKFFVPGHLDGFKLGFVGGRGIAGEAGELSDPFVHVGEADSEGIGVREFVCEHFVTFSCFRRLPLLETHRAQELFLSALEQARINYGLGVFGYVVMPEHVHLLLTEPKRGTLATALKAIKQSVSRGLCVEASTSGRNAITTSMSGPERNA